MRMKNFLRHFTVFLLAVATTLAAATLSLAGMLAITPSIFWGAATVVIAIAYEGQVNFESISSAVRRLFDKNFLKRGVVQDYLENKIKNFKKQNLPIENEFLKTYDERNTFLDKLKELKSPTKQQRQQIKEEEKRLTRMQHFFLRQLQYDTHQTVMEQSVNALVGNDKNKLLKTMNRKLWLIRASWLFTIGAGVSNLFATLGSIKAAAATLTFLSAIPGGLLIAVASVAAVGYIKILYQNVADMVQEWGPRLSHVFKTNLQRKNNEGRIRHALRYTGTVFLLTITVLLAGFVSVATAGTWYKATKQGAAMLDIGKKAAIILRNALIACVLLPIFLFNAFNSTKTIGKVLKKGLGHVWDKLSQPIQKTYRKEHILRFINPFRFAEKLVHYSVDTVFFIAHIASVALMSNQLSDIPPKITASITALSEAPTDANYLGHKTLILKMLFAPVNLAINVLKIAAVAWDWFFSRLLTNSGSLTKSFRKMFPKPKVVEQVIPAPARSNHLKQLEVSEVCDEIIERKPSPDKEIAAKNMKLVVRDEPADNIEKTIQSSPFARQREMLAEHRYCFFRPNKTQSQNDVDDVLRNDADEQANVRPAIGN